MLKKFILNIDFAKSALIGTILADGYIAKERAKSNKDKTYIEITHTSKNLDYLKIKKEIFQLLPDTICTIKEHNKKTENKTYNLYRLCTNSTPYFKELRDTLYNKGIKVFPKEVINNFNDLSLLFLYLDDGTIKVRFYEGTDKLREARISFCLESFTFEELSYFQKFLKSKYNLDFKLYKYNKNLGLNRGYRLYCNTINTRKFMEIIDKYYDCIPSMQYKFLKFYSL